MTIEDVLGSFGFRVRWTVQSHWANVEVYEIVSYQEDGFKLAFFLKDGWKNSEEQTPNIGDAEKYLHGFVKWDGSSELTMGTVCMSGAAEFKKHSLLLRYIYERAFELMQREPDDKW